MHLVDSDRIALTRIAVVTSLSLRVISALHFTGITMQLRKNSRFNASCHRPSCLALGLRCHLGTASAQNAGWDVTKIGGRDYVSVDSIKKFYSFKSHTRRAAR